MPFNLFRKKKPEEDKPLSTLPQDETQPPEFTQPQETTTEDNTQTPTYETEEEEAPATEEESVPFEQTGTQETTSIPQEPEETDLPAQITNGIVDNNNNNSYTEPPETEPVPFAQEENFDATVEDTQTSQEPESLPVQEDQPQQPLVAEAPIVEPTAEKQEVPAPIVEVPSKVYLKAMPLKDLSDTEKVKAEVSEGNIIILRVTPLAGKNIEDVKKAVNDLFEFAETSGGDIARLGEERVVVCPKNIRIWREKTPAPIGNNNEPLPTVA
ncbi:MAG: cell division protein SepF [Nitrososphaerota archaeon]|jgi:SepF-like predicted cell division protein (DUF552 family)|nr:cell division protein SepF [Nitrososphaerota archaeon]